MGVGIGILDFFNRSVLKTCGSIDGKRMLELGDQKIWNSIATKRDGDRVWFKDWIEARGCHHYSIDIHGQNGSHPIDLCKPIKDKFWLGNFDIITNFGTSEHVIDQFVCWQNIHNFGKPGSIYIHVLPEIDKYRPEHCEHWYNMQFFLNLVDANKYAKILLESIPSIGHVACCYFKPKDSAFLSLCSYPITENDFLGWIKKAKK